MKSKELYPAVFSRHAAAYQRRLVEIMAKGEARGRLRAIELLRARPGMRVLDLACGPGTLSRILAAQVAPGGVVLGVDLAPGMIELARRMGLDNARFAIMDIERLAVPDSCFDAAICGHGLQFAPDLALALREARRVLRPIGVFAASVPASETKQGVWEVLDSVVDCWLPPPPVVVDEQATRSTVRDAQAFEAAALGAGFATARVESVEEEVVWESAEQLVSMFMGWWDFAYRIEGLDAASAEAFRAEAVEAVKRVQPGPITTHARTQVLLAGT